jgi:hypothetical protein
MQRAQHPPSRELESAMSMSCPTVHPHRLLVSPDGMSGANVHPLDAPNPLYAGWSDLTDLNDEEFEREVCGRQREALAMGAHP